LNRIVIRVDLKSEIGNCFSVGLGLTPLSLILSPSLIDIVMEIIEEYISLIITDSFPDKCSGHCGSRCLVSSMQ
jgi:hypothetical protein